MELDRRGNHRSDMAAKPNPSPFRFGFYAGLGFMCAQIVFGLLVFAAVMVLGVGTLLGISATHSSVTPIELDRHDSAAAAAYSPGKAAHR